MSDDTMKGITERIKRRRQQLGYSLQDLSDRTGLSKSTLQRYETGFIKNLPLDKLDKLKTLALALHASPEWVLGWSDDIGGQEAYEVNIDICASNKEEAIANFVRMQLNQPDLSTNDALSLYESTGYRATPIRDEDIKYALFGDPNFNNEAFEEVKRYAAFIKSKFE